LKFFIIEKNRESFFENFGKIRKIVHTKRGGGGFTGDRGGGFSKHEKFANEHGLTNLEICPFLY